MEKKEPRPIHFTKDVPRPLPAKRVAHSITVNPKATGSITPSPLNLRASALHAKNMWAYNGFAVISTLASHPMSISLSKIPGNPRKFSEMKRPDASIVALTHLLDRRRTISSLSRANSPWITCMGSNSPALQIVITILNGVHMHVTATGRLNYKNAVFTSALIRLILTVVVPNSLHTMTYYGRNEGRY
jgi:hypothetical protein